jgi:hypothetical protein
LRHNALRERLKYQASPLAMVLRSASSFMCATISTSPVAASVATQVTSPRVEFGLEASLPRGHVHDGHGQPSQNRARLPLDPRTMTGNAPALPELSRNHAG